MVWWIVGVVVLVLLYLAWTYNRLVGLEQACRRRLERHRRPAQAAMGPGAVPGRDGQGLRSARVEHAGERRRGEVQATQAGSLTQRGESERGLSSAVGRLFALAEAYPELKASQNFQDLQKSLVEIENNVQYARRYYNAVVRDLNTLVQSFPSNLLAAAHGIRRADAISSSMTPSARCPGSTSRTVPAPVRQTSTPAGSSPASPADHAGRGEESIVTTVYRPASWCWEWSRIFALGAGPGPG